MIRRSGRTSHIETKYPFLPVGVQQRTAYATRTAAVVKRLSGDQVYGNPMQFWSTVMLRGQFVLVGLFDALTYLSYIRFALGTFRTSRRDSEANLISIVPTRHVSSLPFVFKFYL